ncbi:MAG: prolipoprotein diacylglyceryl transferase, partial [Clostridia bacterium]|nr:prolipoprotein diacylglyceryl transferase [Clostridia bacterium]
SELISLIRSNAFPESFNVGFVYYGGFLSGILGAYLTSKLLRFPLLAYARRMLPALSLAHAFGRIGCFLAGCCYGVESKLLGVCYPESNLLTNAPKGVPLFPVQLLEAFLLLLIAFMLYRLMQKTSLHPLKSYILLYAPVRFLLEFLRYDSVRGAFLFLSTSQWISLILILLALMPVKSIHRH